MQVLVWRINDRAAITGCWWIVKGQGAAGRHVGGEGWPGMVLGWAERVASALSPGGAEETDGGSGGREAFNDGWSYKPLRMCTSWSGEWEPLRSSC